MQVFVDFAKNWLHGFYSKSLVAKRQLEVEAVGGRFLTPDAPSPTSAAPGPFFYKLFLKPKYYDFYFHVTV